ncbi:two-component hybrid sensor and regulator histidine kinase [Capsaspora owczarzaki ATCC 30864]|uniref:two-component hybrid sensor and regulator histidine kinase n=1 Tax=Capsaspora owczarzaki (strain ATCC 30864) TaxID=595528 RepID=UPI0003521B66|nr:two-component hybrid sensor and regulator histidine kinase [Capsaspora owczarzaki ATCC 30864]|eukprot:XP_004346386.2 two-component hybrid sensor and regulator histidine kinase [Capsaspora owczarzaki ATCC 30864]
MEQELVTTPAAGLTDRALLLERFRGTPMHVSPTGTNETQRLASLWSYRVMDSGREEQYDDIVSLAADLCACPVAVINFVGEESTYFKAAYGIGGSGTPRSISICDQAIRRKPPTLFPSLSAAAVMEGNPLVHCSGGMEFYLGVPIIDPRTEQAVGALCVVDYKPRTLSDATLKAMSLLAKQVIAALESRRRLIDLIEMQQELDKANRLKEQALQARETFLASMSHEIRTPMNAILGLERLISNTSLTLEQQQYVSMIQTSGRMLLTIVDDVLDFAAMQANDGLVKLDEVPSSPIEVIETAAMLTQNMANERGLAFGLFVDPKVPNSLMLDRVRFQQVLLNVLTNAIKFTRRGHVELRVTGEWVTSTSSTTAEVTNDNSNSNSNSDNNSNNSLAPPTDAQAAASPAAASSDSPRFKLRVSVKDTGIGISPAQLATLFQPFSQVHHSRGELGGTGLGLVICSRLVRALGGEKLDVESTEGVGSTFSFTSLCRPSPIQELPTTPTPPTTASSPEAPPALANGASHRVSHPNLDRPDLDGYQLTIAQRNLLANKKCVFLGAVTVSTALWLELLSAYQINVQVASSFDTFFSDYDTAKASTIDIFLADLDTLRVMESTLLNALCEVGPLVLVEEKVRRPSLTGADQPSSNGHSGTPEHAAASDSARTIEWRSASHQRSLQSPLRMTELVRTLCSLLAQPLPVALATRRSSSLMPQVTEVPAKPVATAPSPKATVVDPKAMPCSERTTTPRLTPIAPNFPLRILLAEDNVINQRVLVMLMRKLGYEIQVAENGRAVLHALARETARGREFEYQCILMDASMDDIDGLECTRVIRSQQLPNHIRPFIIAQTANATAEYRVACLDSGMDWYMTKPILIDSLTEALKAAYHWHEQNPLPAKALPPTASAAER